MDRDAEYAAMFNRFFLSGKNSSTYKMVFLRSLLDLGNDLKNKEMITAKRQKWITEEDGKIKLDLAFIAVRFIKYYWDMEYSFHLKQSHYPSDANILKIIKKNHRPGEKPPTLEELCSNKMKDVIDMVIAKSIKPEVLDHLQTDMKNLYERFPRKRYILLDHDIMDFFQNHRITLRAGINYKLTTYLEKINKSTPRIAYKIEPEWNNERTNLSKSEKNKLVNLQDEKCHYCDDKAKKPAYDHVIPFNFIYSTELYNMVLSCTSCNGKKSDKLPIPKKFNEVVDRNNDFTKKWKMDYPKEWYERLFDMCIYGYHGDRDFFESKHKPRIMYSAVYDYSSLKPFSDITNVKV